MKIEKVKKEVDGALFQIAAYQMKNQLFQSQSHCTTYDEVVTYGEQGLGSFSNIKRVLKQRFFHFLMRSLGVFKYTKKFDEKKKKEKIQLKISFFIAVKRPNQPTTLNSSFSVLRGPFGTTQSVVVDPHQKSGSNVHKSINLPRTTNNPSNQLFSES